MLNIFQTSSNNSTALRMQNRGVVSIFGAGYPGCDLAAWVPNAPKMEGESKGGDLPSWHTTFGESLVCYTFCPGWRGKGAARSGAVTFPHQEIRQWVIPFVPAGAGKGRRGLAQSLSRTRKSGSGMERQQSSHCLILGGTKGIYSPRPSSPVPPQRHRQRADNRACEPPVWARSKATYWPLVSFALGRFSKSKTSPRRSSASFSRSISSPTVCKMASVT